MLSVMNPSPQSELRALGKRPLSVATRNFLANKAPWERFVTLTFAHPVAAVRAHGYFRDWARFLAQNVYRSHLTIAWAHGLQARRVIHFHALVAQLDQEAHVEAVQLADAWHKAPGPDAALLADAWHEGPDVDVQEVHNADGAAAYLTRHPSWDLNVACDRGPKCRRSRCLLAPGPWHPSGSIGT